MSRNTELTISRPIAKDQVLKRLSRLITWVRGNKASSSMCPGTTWWVLRPNKDTTKRLPRLSEPMTLAEQLSISDKELANALLGEAKKTTEKALNKTIPNSFKFRAFSTITFVTIISDTVSDDPSHVPSCDNIVTKRNQLATSFANSLDASRTRNSVSTSNPVTPSPNKKDLPYTTETYPLDKQQFVIESLLKLPSKKLLAIALEQIFCLYEEKISSLKAALEEEKK